MPRVYSLIPPIERFATKHMPEPNSGCWLWTAVCDKDGYGKFSEMTWRQAGGRNLMHTAHRFAWKHYRGAIPAGLSVLHKCDVPSCVNPDHLFLGTTADNMADKISKERQVRGETCGKSKLTDAAVRAIRADTRSDEDIAADHRVTALTIRDVKRRKTWRHIE